MAAEMVFQGLSGAGQAIAQGAKEYIEKREESQALAGQLDRIGQMLAGFAAQNPGVVGEEDQALISKIAKAPAGSLAQQKATLADALLWMESKTNQVRQNSLSDYYAAQKGSMESATKARDQALRVANDTRAAARAMLLPPDPDLPYRTHGLAALPPKTPAQMMEGRLANVLSQFPNADPVQLSDIAMGGLGRGVEPVEKTMPSGSVVIYSPTTGRYDIVPPKVPDKVQFSPDDRARLMAQRLDYLELTKDSSLSEEERATIQLYIKQIDGMLLQNAPTAAGSAELDPNDPLELWK